MSVAGAGGAGNINYDTGDLYIGSYDGTQLYWLGDLAELLVYNTGLKLPDSGRVANYLASRYAL